MTWFLAIPHYVVLMFLWIAAVVIVIIAWFAILFTGQYPRGMFDFVEGVIRWYNRVIAYALVLVTDQYPPVPPDAVRPAWAGHVPWRDSSDRHRLDAGLAGGR